MEQFHTEPKERRRLEFDGLRVADEPVSEGDFLMRAGSKLDKIQEQVEDILDIRSKELPAFWEKILFTQLRILHVGRFQVRQSEKAR